MPRIVEEVWECGRCGKRQRAQITPIQMVDKAAEEDMPPGWCKLDMISNEGRDMGALDLCHECRAMYHDWVSAPALAPGGR